MAGEDKDLVREEVRRRYGSIQASGCGCGTGGCCSGPAATDYSARIGYSAEELAAAPEGANMGLGCGNPQAMAALQPGEVVLDLGSGGGFDCFLAARKVGETGRVIGIDMTPEMILTARRNAGKGGYTNVEFRLGEIEHIPVADNSVDVIISNCVINLSPDKPAVFEDAFRVLKPGGRLAISDVVATSEIPEEVRKDMDLHASCISGASSVAELERMMREAGFESIKIDLKEESREFIKEWADSGGGENYICSALIEGVKPGRNK